MAFCGVLFCSTPISRGKWQKLTPCVKKFSFLACIPSHFPYRFLGELITPNWKFFTPSLSLPITWVFEYRLRYFFLSKVKPAVGFGGLGLMVGGIDLYFFLLLVILTCKKITPLPTGKRGVMRCMIMQFLLSGFCGLLIIFYHKLIE